MIQGIDISKHQGVMNWDITKSKGVRFAFIKAGGDSSTGFYKDSQLDRNAAECKRVGIPQSYYWFMYPRSSGKAQADYFFNLIKDKPKHPKLSLVLDFEVDTWGASRQTEAVKQFYNQMNVLGKPCEILYTRAEFLHRETVPDPIWAKFQLFVARYIDADKPWGNRYDYAYMTPPYFKTWTFWQYSADGNRQGHKYGAQSYDIDLDQFNGDEAAWKAYLAEVPKPPEEPMWPKKIQVVRAGGTLLHSKKSPSLYVGLVPSNTKLLADTVIQDGAGVTWYVSGDVLIRLSHCELI